MEDKMDYIIKTLHIIDKKLNLLIDSVQHNSEVKEDITEEDVMEVFNDILKDVNNARITIIKDKK